MLFCEPGDPNQVLNPKMDHENPFAKLLELHRQEGKLPPGKLFVKMATAELVRDCGTAALFFDNDQEGGNCDEEADCSE